MAASIRVHGVSSPILVRPHPAKPGTYEIVYGERRYRGSIAAGQTTIPAIIRDIDDKTVAELQLVENLQREGVHELDEARGYERLMRDHDQTAGQIAERISKSEKYVWDRLKLLALIPELQKRFYDGRFSAGHAIILARLSEGRQRYAAEHRLAESLSVRALGQAMLQKVAAEPKDNLTPEPKAFSSGRRPPLQSHDFRAAAEAILAAARSGNPEARQALAAIMADMGRRGGEARKKRTTKAERRAWALKGNHVRWRKHGKPKR
jgi:ParB/RepB/Spo0J family partition protein